METGEIRFVWLLVFFDLPVTSKVRMASANRFRNFLKKDGFMMLQLSVYARVCRGQDAVDKHLLRIRNALPPEGCVRSLQVTDRQYARMDLMLGPPAKSERFGAKQLILL